MDEHQITLGWTVGRMDKWWEMLIWINEKLWGYWTVHRSNQPVCTGELLCRWHGFCCILGNQWLISAYFPKMMLTFAYLSCDKYETELAFDLMRSDTTFVCVHSHIKLAALWHVWYYYAHTHVRSLLARSNARSVLFTFPCKFKSSNEYAASMPSAIIDAPFCKVWYSPYGNF